MALQIMDFCAIIQKTKNIVPLLKIEYMPKVFSPTELRDGKIPSLADFLLTAEQIHFALNACDGVIGGFVYGSVFHGTHDIQSDIDLFVLLLREKEEGVFAEIQKLQGLAKSKSIPFEIVAIDQKTAESSANYIGPQFVHHLTLAAADNKLIKSNPFKRVMLHPIDQKDDALNYFQNRFRMMNKGYTQTGCDLRDEKLYVFLQNVLQLPMHVARVVLYHCNIRLGKDSNREVMKKYFDITSREAYNLFFQLLVINNRYQNQLREEITKGYDEERYCKAIKELIEGVPLFLKFLRLNFTIIEAKYRL